jgi:hypothetical protein
MEDRDTIVLGPVSYTEETFMYIYYRKKLKGTVPRDF